MKQWLVNVMALVVTSVLSLNLNAGAVEDAIIQRLKESRPDLEVQSIEPSPLKGFYQLQFVNGPLVQIDASGEFFVLGDLYQVTSKGLVNLAEEARNGVRAELLAGVSEKEMIIFPAEGTERGVITVFTDVDCGYCQLLHKEVPALNAMGVSVHYLAYPRGYGRNGERSESFRKIASAWCAEDRPAALTALKNQQVIEINVCEGNPIAAQFALGEAMGVEGTPALILSNGRMLPGYMPAQRLLAEMGLAPLALNP